MTRTVFTGGRIFDGTGADPADADIAIEDGRILEVGRGLDADEQVEVSGKAILPGLFDCHTHVMFSHIDFLKSMEEPFSYKFFDWLGTWRRRFASASPPSATPRERTWEFVRPWRTD